MSFKLIGLNDGKDLLEKTFTFNGGEEYVKLHSILRNQVQGYSLNYGFKLIAHLKDSKDVMKLLMIKDAFDRLEFDKRPELHLVMPYVPYARQDRVCVTGESHSLAVFCKLINACEFTSVTVVDPHSHVTEALLNNVNVITQLNIISNSEFNTYVVKNIRDIVLVSPDAGANKKTFEVSKYFSVNFIRCDKLRDLATGQIKETIVYADDLKGKTCVILDDIIDAGRTFTELAKVLKAKGAEKVILFVTHGIFSAGINTLFSNGIDEIWTTDSFDHELARREIKSTSEVDSYHLIELKKYTSYDL